MRVSIDRLVLVRSPISASPATPGCTAPSGTTGISSSARFKYTLWRLQERVVGQGPDVPQVPVIPSPTEPGQVVDRIHRPAAARRTTARPCPPRRHRPSEALPAEAPDDRHRRRRLVELVRAGHRRRAWLSAAALILTLVVASGIPVRRCAAGQPVRLDLSGHCRATGIRRTAAQPGRDAARRADRPGGSPGHHPGGRQRDRQRQVHGADTGVERRAGVGTVRRRASSTSTSPRFGRGTLPDAMAASSSRAGRPCR